jgi:gamma-glutamylcyclotransferase (GGCT)/AIG2-like uncharacterized protein YtfP
MNNTPERERLLFVYGTLQRGGKFHGSMIHAGATFLTEASQTAKDFIMKDLTHYPALVEAEVGTGSYIMGELYSIPTKNLGIIDAVEGYPTYYKRKTTTVWANGSPFEALVYYLDAKTFPMVNNSPTIDNGTWVINVPNASFAADVDIINGAEHADTEGDDCPRCGWWIGQDGCANCASFDAGNYEFDPADDYYDAESTEYKTSDYTVAEGIYITDMDGNQYGVFEDIADACNNIGNVANIAGCAVDMLTIGFRVIYNHIAPATLQIINNATTNIKGN